MRARPRQLQFEMPTWGGRRAGAGRKAAPGHRPGVPHRRRAPHDVRCPVHATLRLRAGLPSLRDPQTFVVVRGALAAASAATFRVVHFSVLADHVHLLVEADRPNGLARGLQGLAIRVAKAVNRTLSRHGRVFAERYHARSLKTPREVRNALAYVLQNFRKHVPGARGLDPRSSGRWFDGWLTPVPTPAGAAAGGRGPYVARAGRLAAARADRRGRRSGTGGATRRACRPRRVRVL